MEQQISQSHPWASKIIQLHSEVGRGFNDDMIYLKQCLLFKSLIDLTSQYIHRWWIDIFKEETSSKSADAVGKELLTVLNAGKEILQSCAAKEVTMINIGSASEFHEIIDDVKMYAQMMNRLISSVVPPDNQPKRGVIDVLTKKVKYDCEALQSTLPFAWAQDKIALLQSFEKDATRWKQKHPKSISKAFQSLLTSEGEPKIPTIDSKDLFQGQGTLGKGAFGKVNRAFWLKLPVAYKVFRDSSCSSHNRRSRSRKYTCISLSLEKELEAFDTLLPSYPSHVVQVLGYFVKRSPKTNSDFEGLVLELMETDLGKLIKERGMLKSMLESVDIMLQIAKGMKQLHEKNVIYRDLKPSNVLVKTRKDKSLLIKVADFGTAKGDFQSTVGTMTMTMAGTVYYMAPEVLEGKNYTKKVDVFSFAMVCSYILIAEHPFRDKTIDEIKLLLSNDTRPELPKGIPDGLQELIECCWKTAPNDRPSFEAACDRLWAVKEELLTN